MKKQTKLLLGTTALVASAVALNIRNRKQAPLDTVPNVDLKRYAGRWYEISKIPQYFEKGCHCVYAEYTLNPEGYVEVNNACHKGSPSGKLDVAKGKAFPIEGSHNSKLKVQFFWPFKGDYWILELDPDYRYALVGSPDRKSLWILSRTPTLDSAVYDLMVQQAKSKGFPVERLCLTDQSCYT
ncbi:apolipoprotein D and lipocalin family protein [Pontibacter ummariensis]|uniref:Apolipoprotein D and lipocalin family protein n=1 Tax=Pontibacter ummariensis TaxID=1610492 RepID=A0A239IK21_9BACT|nr:lipocalin family protein [Pontibacter ummariensis]PRY09879.1 apolipoprotein D and lipocalin family protein [Pontibacter ummariensis]SNS93762.1 apolipoprotein D and lipocalin family protein [Pontibacter ummariensis]